MTEASSSEETKTVTVDSDQLARLLSTVEDLSKKVESLQNELEASHSTGTVQDLVGQSGKQEAVLHTIQRMNMSRGIMEDLKRTKTDKVVDLAVDAAILNYKQHPPKHRM